MGKELRTLRRAGALGFAGAAVSGLATVAVVLIAARALDPTGTGRFFVAVSLVALAQGICSLGLDTGLQYTVPTLHAGAARRLTLGSTAAGGLAGVVAALAVWASAPGLSSLLGSDDAIGLVRMVGVSLPIVATAEVAFGALRSVGSIAAAVAVDRILRPVAQVGTMLAGAWLGAGATGLVACYLVPVVVSVVIAIAILLRPLRSAADGADGGGEIDLPAFARYTAPRTLARVAQVLTQRLDVVLVATLASVEDAGVYATVARTMIAGVFVATAVQQVVQPTVRRLVLRGDLDAVRGAYGSTTAWLVLCTWPAYLVLAVFAPVVLGLFGSDAVGGAPALVVLALTMLVASGCGLVDVVLLMVGRSWTSTLIVLAALAIDVSLCVALIPRWGMTGAAVAWSAAILTTNLVPLNQVARLGIHPWGRPLRTALVIGGPLAALPLVAARAISTSPGALGVAVAGAATVVAAAAHRQREALGLARVLPSRDAPAARPALVQLRRTP